MRNKKKEKAKLPLLFCDVDGTLADWSRRRKLAGAEPDRQKDPAAHAAWVETIQNDESLAADPVVPLMPYLVQRLASAFNIVYLTARHEKHYAVTWKWLLDKGFPASLLIMRREGDVRPTAAYKEQAIRDVLAGEKATKALAIDDDEDCTVAAVYESFGITHLKAMACIPSTLPQQEESMTEQFLKTLEVK